MKANKFLITAILVITIGAPIAGFVGDIKLPLSTIPTGEPIAFFTGLALARLPINPGLHLLSARTRGSTHRH
ncbi:MAG: hypothetical protein WA710_22885 [Pseudolabrys sp.]